MIFVSPTSGSDSNTGSFTLPVKTLAQAQTLSRQYNDKTISLLTGIYDFSTTGLGLTSADNGLLIQSYTGQDCILTGATQMSSSWFSPVTSSDVNWSRLTSAAQSGAYVCNLNAHGITNSGSFSIRGFNTGGTAQGELLCNGQVMTLAEYPKSGTRSFELIIQTNGSSSFVYEGTEPSKWQQPSAAKVHAFFSETWADYHMPMLSVNTASNTITLGSSVPGGGIVIGGRWRAYNILEELSLPNEYYLETGSGNLYFIPPTTISQCNLSWTLTQGTLVFFTSCSNATISGVTLEGSRASLMFMDTASNFNTFQNCTFRNAGRTVTTLNGTGNVAVNCLVYGCGEQGFIVAGGSRSNLTNANNGVTNSILYNNGRWCWTSFPAIDLTFTTENGCGNFATYNSISEQPNSAIMFGGNNHTMSFNEISRVGLLTADAGGIYAGRDWGYRGNTVNNNFLHHLITYLPAFPGTGGGGVHGVYLDDLVAGVNVTNNIFYKIQDTGIFMGGGRDNIMNNNVLVNCFTGHFAGDYARTSFSNVVSSSFNLLQRLSAFGISYQTAPWSTAYPLCAAITNSYAACVASGALWVNPQNCQFSTNSGWGNNNWTFQADLSNTGQFGVYATMSNNNSTDTPFINDLLAYDRTLRSDTVTSPTISGFNPIQFQSIGPTGFNLPTFVPDARKIYDVNVVSGSEVQLSFSYGSKINSIESHSYVEMQVSGNTDWQFVTNLNPGVCWVNVTGLYGQVAYNFRITAVNSVGSSISNIVSATTDMIGSGSTQQIVSLGVGTGYNLIQNIGIHGTVGTFTDSFLAPYSNALSLPDNGDIVDIPFTIGSTAGGYYTLAMLVKCGHFVNSNDINLTSYWASGYKFELDGTHFPTTGNPASVSGLDTNFVNSYWGQMVSQPMYISSGSHALRVIVTNTLNSSAYNYLQLTPWTSSPLTFSQWQQAYFTQNQITSSKAANAVSPLNDGYSNYLKYITNISPWSSPTSISQSAGGMTTTYFPNGSLTISRP